jgi:signal transduction histidine kinase/CheY-like chemotaxis protein
MTTEMTGGSLDLKREVVLECGDDGTVRSLDAVAERLLGCRPGQRLQSLAPEGTAEKVDDLLRRARHGVAGWEVCLCVDNRPATFAFAGRPGRAGEGIVLVGSLVPDQYSSALTRVQETMSELAALQRQAQRQQVELQRRNTELIRLNAELDDSARGMVALHAEVEEKADSLRRVSEVKSRVVSNVSHEFRTPLNSIVSLANLLLSRVDGELSPEQDKQLTFIRQSAQQLSELVNDMLDLSKIEAGKTALRPHAFTVGSLFAALRGLFRAVHHADAVALEFDEAHAAVALDTDEGKVTQVLRNFISNALKFTERGSVRVSASAIEDGFVTFRVADTGIGIAAADHERVFEEFAQIDHPLQRTVRGTGLGLTLSRQLARLLGGDISLESTPGRGSTFALRIPAVHTEVQEMAALVERSAGSDPDRAPILVVEDDTQTLFLYERYLRNSGFRILPARSVSEARAALQRVRPAAVVLDVMLDGETSWSFLAELKTGEATRAIPVLVVTVVNRERKARALGADEFLVKPLDQESIVRKLESLAKGTGQTQTVLVADDDEVSRYMVRRLLEGSAYRVVEAADGDQALALARSIRPDVLLLDFVMPGTPAFDVIDELKGDPATRDIPIVVHTSKSLDEAERLRLARDTASILPKESVTREVAIGRIRDALLKAGLGPAARQESPRG